MLALFNVRATPTEIVDEVQSIYTGRCDEDKIKIEFENIAKDVTYQANPVQYVYEWRKNHKDNPMLNYQFLGGRRNYKHLSTEACAVTRLAQVLIAQPDYADTFKDWAQKNVKEMIVEIYPETTDEDYLQSISRLLLEVISQEDFLTSLKGLQKIITGQKDFFRGIEEEKNKFAYFLNDYIDDPSQAKDLRRRQQENLIWKVFMDFFDLSYNM